MKTISIHISSIISIIGILLLFPSSSSSANTSPPTTTPPITIGYHLVSYHSEPNYNNFNPGIYIVNGNIITGAYINSHNNFSAYAGFRKSYEYVDLNLALVTGYPNHPLKLVFIPTLKLNNMRIAYKPKMGEGSSHVIHIMYEYEYK